jgi:hypothetical protein
MLEGSKMINCNLWIALSSLGKVEFVPVLAGFFGYLIGYLLSYYLKRSLVTLNRSIRQCVGPSGLWQTSANDGD